MPDEKQQSFPLTPGEVLREMLSRNDWTQDELAQIMGVSRVSIVNLLAGRSGITAEMAASLAAAFGNEPTYWMNLDAEYRLSRLRSDFSPIERRAKLFQIAPIREMQRRGWIAETTTLAELELELERFFGEPVRDDAPLFRVATRRSASRENLTAAEGAWCFEARRLASATVANAFSLDRMNRLFAQLRKFAAYPKESRKVAGLLAEYGIRFVVVEPISGAKIDGAAFWLNDDAPVVAVSLRFDRIDAFWFTLMHECAHIYHLDALSVDSNLVGDVTFSGLTTVAELIEQRANQMAANSLIDQEELESFIRRVGPFYSKERIIQFAHTVKMHPGIIVGQLQHRGEISYATNRPLLAKVRDEVISTALTDGWGHTISPGSL